MREQKFTSVSSGDTRDSADNLPWIYESFPTFADFAAAGYREYGRGVIALGIQETDVRETPTHFYPMVYVASEEIGDWNWKNRNAITKMVKEYEPMYEFILVLRRQDWEHVIHAGHKSE